YTNYFTVYIDWNQDGDFNDANEVYSAGSVNSSTGEDAKQAVTQIAVPYHALAGATRMRVQKLYNTASSNPCSGGNYGQTEDYTVIVTKCAPASTFYADTDNDGFGNAESSVEACNAPAGYVADNTDCDDNNASVYHSAALFIDADLDGYGS